MTTIWQVTIHNLSVDPPIETVSFPDEQTAQKWFDETVSALERAGLDDEFDVQAPVPVVLGATGCMAQYAIDYDVFT